ncbi:hybrid sensor histidine kinase/response regulator [Thaumasiovibrio subtropicus]|uniref:hybrid sensor histidine kinase/response regulator n=1 Tax=Thaumasiovibrio subtropicus TaxID=1891207 RepID=UPI000B35A631|nr:response regulator [Thaumasiovibrio subtropicus]
MSLRLKTILGIALIEALVLALLIVSGLTWLKESNERQLVSSSQQLASIFSKAIRDSVLSYDLAYLDSFAESVVREHNLTYIRIFDRNGVELATHGSLGEVELNTLPTASSDGVYDVSHRIEVDGQQYGTVALGVRSDNLQLLLRYATTSSLTIAGIEMVLVALFSFALGTYLMKRLELLKKGVEEVGRAGPGTQIEVKGNDEVARVCRAFNEMSLSLAQAQADVSNEYDKRVQLDQQVTVLAQVAQHARDAIVITDANGKTTWVNRAFELLTGYTLVDIKGRSPGELLQGRQTDRRTIAKLSEGIRTARPVRVEILNYDKSGMPYWVDLDVSPVIDDETGEVERFIAVQREVTERRYVEQQLENALDRATKATKAKSEFLANMSHEIRTPMNAIMGISELMLEEVNDTGQKEQLNIIHQSAGNLVNIINDILDYSKIEAGKLTLINEPFDLREVLENSMDVCAYHAEQKGLHLLVDIPSHLNSRVIGDKGRINQILLNLIGNAVKFTSSGHIKLSMRCEDFYQHSRFTIAVEDSGIGIPADRLPHIMREFEQVDNSATRQHQGTGLGLAICNRLVSLFGGQLKVTSREGIGSRFVFSIELPRDESDTPEKVAAINYAARVLYVDDYQPQKEIVCRVLHDLNVDVLQVDSVEQAMIELFDNHVAVDWVLIDVGRDIESDKIEALENLYQHFNHKPLPITLCSPYRLKIPAEDEVLSYLHQPLTQTKLAQLVDKISADNLVMAAGTGQSKSDVEELPALRVLVAEDSPINRLLVEKMLAGSNVDLFMAENGERALIQYQAYEPDIVITDISMPKMDGFDLTTAIRRLQRSGDYAWCPIIALSAHAMVEEQQKSFAAGMDDYLTKPVRKADLIAMIYRWSAVGRGDITAINRHR